MHSKIPASSNSLQQLLVHSNIIGGISLVDNVELHLALHSGGQFEVILSHVENDVRSLGRSIGAALPLAHKRLGAHVDALVTGQNRSIGKGLATARVAADVARCSVDLLKVAPDDCTEFAHKRTAIARTAVAAFLVLVSVRNSKKEIRFFYYRIWEGKSPSLTCCDSRAGDRNETPFGHTGDISRFSAIDEFACGLQIQSCMVGGKKSIIIKL